MRCAACGAENRKGARFCVSCGAKLMLVCHQCGTELIPSAKFCDACGAPVGAPVTEIEEEPGAPDAVAERLQRLVPREFAERLHRRWGTGPGGRT